ncbi:MAG: hypothetical protein L3J57_01705 [Desulfuromusa sp.]|nr:hypothetical protein [Desulfuromusa sp.]
MTPEQLAAIRAIILVLDAVGTWPVGLLLFALLFGPWVGLWTYAAAQSKREKTQEEKFTAVVDMYNSNVELVKSYERSVQRWEKHSDDLSSIIHLNTQMMTRLVEQIKNNMFCPIVREKGQR